jgi:hypothetical protein
VAVGCDTYAYLNGLKNDEPFSIGCLSVCKNTTNVVDGSCDGIGCCQMEIPEGLKQINFTAYSFKNTNLSGTSILAALPSLSEKTSSISPQIIFQSTKQ